MYHHISPARPADAPVDEGWFWWHAPEMLEHHIRELRRRGRQIVSLDEYVEGIATRKPSRHAVVLSFDDGWKDNYDHAMPVLRALEAPATFFVTTAHLAS